MMDREAIWNFASKHVFMGMRYYCNNPICPPDKKEQGTFNLQNYAK
jgi:hypothetical protein